MPWASGGEYASRHNKKLKGAAATKAAHQANAMLKEDVPEGIAIATANKTGNKMMKKSRRETLYDHPRSKKHE